MKQSYKVFKLGKQAVSGVLEAGQMRSIGLAAGLVALGGVCTTELQAQTVTYWADWTLPSYTINNTGVASTYASGATGSINNNGATVGLSLTGEVNANSFFNTFYWYGGTYNPASAYTDSTGADNVGNGPNGTDRIAQTGLTAPADKAHTLTFGSSVQDVVMAVWSLGSPSTVSSLLFTQDFEILSSDRMTKNITANGYELEGYEGAGIIQFLGSYSSISWAVTAPEFYSAFNVGITNNPVTTAAGAVLAIPQATRDITASNDIHTDLGNSSPTNAQLNYVFDGGTLLVGANLTDAFTIKSGGGTVSIASGDIYTMSGVISNATGATGSLTKTGAGTLTLTGTNTYTGGTTVSAGTLDLDGSLTSDVTVASTGRIEGVGSTSGGLTSSGTVAPGNSPGTLSVLGDVVYTSTNTFITELDGLTYSAAGGAGTYDRLAVTGGAATFTAAGAITPILRGISAPANNTLDPVVGDAFRVVTTANASGVSGAFSTITDPTSGMPTNTRFDVLYGGNYVDLVLTPDDLSTFAAAYGIQNMVNAADAFDGIRPAQGTNGTTDKDKFFNGLYGLTAQETAVALLQASGEVHAFALSDARDAWSDGLGTVRSSSQGVGDYYWVDMSGYNLAVDEDTIASAYDSKTRKFWIGSDVYQDRSTTYGFALGVSESELSMANSRSADTTTYSLAGYMRGAQGAFEYDGLVSLNRSNIDTNRSVSLSTGSLSNTSSSDVRGLAMSAQLGYRYDVAPSLVSGLAWIKGDLDNTRTDTFTEDGSTVTALTVNGYEVKSAKVSVGYTLSGKIPNSGVEAGLWSFGVGAAKDVSRGMPDVSRTMSLHGASWSVSVPKAGDVTKFVSGGIAIPLGNDAVAELSLSAAKRDGALSKSAAFGFSAKW